MNTFEDGQPLDGDYKFLNVLAVAICMRDSSWDFPSFVFALELGHLFPNEDPTMYPTREDATIIANGIDLELQKDRDEFVNDFPLIWDT